MTLQQIERMRDVARNYRQANKEKIAAYGRRWAEANRAKRVATARAWQKSNPDKLAIIARRYRLNNLDTVRAAQRRYRLENPDKVRAGKARWRQKRRAAQAIERQKKEEALIRSRLQMLSEHPLSSAEQLALYRSIEALLPRYYVPDSRSEIANMAFIAVYEGRLPMGPSYEDLRPIIAAQRREYFGAWDLSLDAIDGYGRSLGTKLGVY
jgi:hypothetical protein